MLPSALKHPVLNTGDWKGAIKSSKYLVILKDNSPSKSLFERRWSVCIKKFRPNLAKAAVTERRERCSDKTNIFDARNFPPITTCLQTDGVLKVNNNAPFLSRLI
jgi:hypothetical protein